MFCGIVPTLFERMDLGIKSRWPKPRHFSSSKPCGTVAPTSCRRSSFELALLQEGSRDNAAPPPAELGAKRTPHFKARGEGSGESAWPQRLKIIRLCRLLPPTSPREKTRGEERRRRVFTEVVTGRRVPLKGVKLEASIPGFQPLITRIHHSSL